MDWIQALNSVAACLHGAQAIVVVSLIAWLDSRSSSSPGGGGAFANNGVFTVQRFIPVWTSHGENHLQAVDSGVFDTRSAILAFFVISCIAHTAAAVFWEGRLGAFLHFAEYSVSAALALCAIAVEAGIRDAYTLQAQFVLVFATMVLGMAAEFTQTPQRPVLPCALFHLAGWVTCLSAYVPAMDVYMQSMARSVLKPPAFVSALVWVELALFVCFGFVQLYALVARANLFTAQNDAALMMYSLDGHHSDSASDLLAGGGGNGSSGGGSGGGDPGSAGWLSPYDARALMGIDERVELSFIVLSLVAKTCLAWLVLSPLIA